MNRAHLNRIPDSFRCGGHVDSFSSARHQLYQSALERRLIIDDRSWSVSTIAVHVTLRVEPSPASPPGNQYTGGLRRRHAGTDLVFDVNAPQKKVGSGKPLWSKRDALPDTVPRDQRGQCLKPESAPHPHSSGRAKVPPLGQCDGSALLECPPVDEGAF